MKIALIDLDSVLRSAQNCKKCTFLDNLRTITQEKNINTRQMTPFFSSTFSDLKVRNNSEFGNPQKSLSCGPPLVHSGL